MPRPVEVVARARYRVFVRFDDGVAGEVDLGDLAGRGVFAAWQPSGAFERVRIAASGAIEWDGDLDLCPDAIYLRLTGQTPEQLFPALRAARVDA